MLGVVLVFHFSQHGCFHIESQLILNYLLFSYSPNSQNVVTLCYMKATKLSSSNIFSNETDGNRQTFELFYYKILSRKMYKNLISQNPLQRMPFLYSLRP